MDAESCYLGFEISFQSNADKAMIEDAFEFVREDAKISILPPHSHIDKYIDLIQSLPDSDMKLGEILVRCGTLTHWELANGLQSQLDNEVEQQEHHPIGEVLVAQQVVDALVVSGL
jgi:two-component system chemotaxis sensor kinase CheA